MCTLMHHYEVLVVFNCTRKVAFLALLRFGHEPYRHRKETTPLVSRRFWQWYTASRSGGVTLKGRRHWEK
jgi:hypothetical protein